MKKLFICLISLMYVCSTSGQQCAMHGISIENDTIFQTNLSLQNNGLYNIPILSESGLGVSIPIDRIDSSHFVFRYRSDTTGKIVLYDFYNGQVDTIYNDSLNDFSNFRSDGGNSLYGMTSGLPVNLYSMDLTTGVFDTITTLDSAFGFTSLSSAIYHDSIYACRILTPSGDFYIASIHLKYQDSITYVLDDKELVNISFQSNSNTLIGYSIQESKFMKMDLTTGQYDSIPNTYHFTSVDLGKYWYEASTDLYYFSGNEGAIHRLYELDPSTGDFERWSINDHVVNLLFYQYTVPVKPTLDRTTICPGDSIQVTNLESDSLSLFWNNGWPVDSVYFIKDEDNRYKVYRELVTRCRINSPRIFLGHHSVLPAPKLEASGVNSERFCLKDSIRDYQWWYFVNSFDSVAECLSADTRCIEADCGSNRDYFAELIDINGCSVYTDTVMVVLGYEETFKQSLNVYPNPVTNTIKIETLPTDQVVQVRELTGKLLLAFVANTMTEYDLSSLPNGVYLIEVLGKSPRSTRIIKTQ